MSEYAAFALAQCAYSDGFHFSIHDNRLGLGATSKLTVNNEREGRNNEIYIYSFTENVRFQGYLKFVNKTTRLEQELICAKFILYVLHCAVQEKVETDNLRGFLTLNKEDVVSLTCSKN